MSIRLYGPVQNDALGSNILTLSSLLLAEQQKKIMLPNYQKIGTPPSCLLVVQG